MFVKLAAIFFSMILVNNYVLVKFYGICPFLGVSKKLDSSVGMSGAVIFVMLVATAVTFPIQIFILDAGEPGLPADHRVHSGHRCAGAVHRDLPEEVRCCTVQFAGRLPAPDHHQLLRAGRDHSGRGRLRRRCCYPGFGAAYIEALVCAVGAGVGFMLAMVMFSGVRKRVEACDPPAPFKGLPITLIAAAITSLSFMGFGGIVENLFNVTL